MKSSLIAAFRFGLFPAFIAGLGLFIYFKSDGEFGFSDFVIKESYPHHDRYPDCVWGSDLYVSFGDGRFALYHEHGEYRGYYSLYDRKESHDLLLHITKAEQRKNIIRLWDKDGREYILDFLAPTLDGRCIECGKIHLEGVCSGREIMYYSDSTN